MIPLLEDEGDSIRRLAARAIGSRWWQISNEDKPRYLKALKSRTKYEDEERMRIRAIGLLTRNYKNRYFSQSPNKRWVFYERHLRPCLIDTTTGTEELIGWVKPGSIDNDFNWIYGVDDVSEEIVWHPKKEMAAIRMIIARYATVVRVWKYGTGIIDLDLEKLVQILIPTKKEGEEYFSMLSLNNPRWKGDQLKIQVSYSRTITDTFVTEDILWDVNSNTIRKVKLTRKPE